MSVQQIVQNRKLCIKIGALAGVDERTVRALLTGSKRTLPPVEDAIRRVMRELGIEVRL